MDSSLTQVHCHTQVLHHCNQPATVWTC